MDEYLKQLRDHLSNMETRLNSLPNHNGDDVEFALLKNQIEAFRNDISRLEIWHAEQQKITEHMEADEQGRARLNHPYSHGEGT